MHSCLYIYPVLWMCDGGIGALCCVVAEGLVVHALEQGVPLQEYLYSVYFGDFLLDVCREYHAQ